jgi:hypothetical protein
VIRHYQPAYYQWTLPRKKTEFFSKLLVEWFLNARVSPSFFHSQKIL